MIRALCLSFLALVASFSQAAELTGRKLTSTEVKALMPEYVAFVESKAETVLSAEEALAVRSLATVAGPTVLFDSNVRVVGLKGPSADLVVSQIENVIEVLKNGTPASRRASADGVLKGFKGLEKAGKISCRLGYARGYKVATERIVTCKDDRSVAPDRSLPDSEGFYDVREFILSIDAKTLKPVGVLSYRHDQAG